MQRIILASASPRRYDILKMMGLDFEVIESQVDESGGSLAPDELVKAFALKKAEAVAARRPGALVIGADTIVYIDGEILGKPKDERDAFAMLKRLCGRTHEVYTGVAVICAELRDARVARTFVEMDELSDEVISEYIRCGEPMDKAGAYAIQGMGGMFITRIEGCGYNVMGLPMNLAYKMLAAAGIDPIRGRH